METDAPGGRRSRMKQEPTFRCRRSKCWSPMTHGTPAAQQLRSIRKSDPSIGSFTTNIWCLHHPLLVIAIMSLNLYDNLLAICSTTDNGTGEGGRGRWSDSPTPHHRSRRPAVNLPNSKQDWKAALHHHSTPMSNECDCAK